MLKLVYIKNKKFGLHKENVPQWKKIDVGQHIE
jgi:hypothetical protein